MKLIVTFCYDNNVVLVANETLQDAIHDDKIKFTSFRKVIQSMDKPYNNLEAFSFFSASKSIFFERSFRSGILDILNIDKEVSMQLYKYKSIDLCSNVPGQIIMDLVLNPPTKEESDQGFAKEYEESVKKRRKDIKDNIDSLRNAFASNIISLPHIQAGYNFFSKINTNRSISSGKDYSNRLLKEANVLVGLGEDYGNNNKNNVAINCNYVDEKIINSILRFNKSLSY